MPLKIYQKFGLRRDRNLGDVNNSSVALTNILDNVVGDKEFKSEDINVLKGIFSQGLDADTFLQVGGSAEQTTDSQGNTDTLTPYISYQNRLDLSALYAGTPRIFGGDGPNARYYDFDQVLTTLPTSDDDILNSGVWVSGDAGIPFAEDQFWEKGNFGWDKKLHEKSATVDGGIEWEGYYVPTGTGQHSIYISTTGCWTFDFQKEGYGNKFINGQNWDTSSQDGDTGTDIYKNYATIRPEVTLSCSHDPNDMSSTQIKLANESDFNKVAIGMTCVDSNIVDGQAEIIDYSETNGLITLEGTAPAGTASWTSNVQFVHSTEQDTYNTYTISYPLTKGIPYRIRFRYFIPTTWDSNKSNRYFDISEILPDGGGQGSLNYRKLYNLNYDFSDEAKGSFNKFIDNSILFGGGITGGNTQDKYTSVYSTKKVDARYDPINLTLTDDYNTSSVTVSGVQKSYRHKKIIIWSGTLTALVANTTAISMSNTSGMEVGNYFYDDGWATSGATRNKLIPDGTRIVEVIQNSSIILSNPVTFSGTTYCRIIEHRGHVQRFIANSTNGSPTLTVNTNGPTLGNGTEDVLKRKMIVVGGSATLDRNTQINKRPNSNSSLELTTNAKNTTTNQVFYVYDYQGLNNYSLVPFCDTQNTGFENLCVDVIGDVTAGTSSFEITAGTDTLGQISNIQANINHRVLGSYFQDGTQIQSWNPTTKIITLNKNVAKVIKAGNNFTLTQESTGDRSMCCPPKDTAPPFQATDNGMVTKENYETLDVKSGNVKFDNIRATLKSDQILEPGDIDDNNVEIKYNGLLNKQLNRRIRFKGGDGTAYRLFVEKP